LVLLAASSGCGDSESNSGSCSTADCQAGGSPGSAGSGGPGGDHAGGNTVGAAGATGGSDAAGGATGSGSLCPEEEPTDGEPCPEFGLSCSYGDALLPECRVTWSCRGASDLSWSGSEPDTDCATAQDDCPPTQPEFDDPITTRRTCAYDDVICVYAPLATEPCQCESSGWHCSEVDDACPARVPNDGTRCSDDELRCSYIVEHCTGDSESESFSVICRDGSWHWNRSQCLS
jgi:hypothetical protein